MMPDKIHLVGIGGAGMAPLARILLEQGRIITGSDSAGSESAESLKSLGARVNYGHRAENLPQDCLLVIYSSAVPPENPERMRARELNIPELRRGEALAEIMRRYRRPVAVSGSHGKSSITAMLTHILRRAGLSPGYLIGAELCDGAPSAAAGDGDLFIAEVDESDGTHACCSPALGIVPNIESDHCWSVGGEERLYANFRRFGLQSGRLLYCDSERCRTVFSGHPDAVPVRPPERFGRWRGYQAPDAFLAVCAAGLLGIPEDQAETMLDDFPGIARRLSVRCSSPELVIIEDYAHHPTEVTAAIRTLRELYPEFHLRILFQPHRYARLEKYFDEFAAALQLADSTVVAPVFAAWCETGGKNSADLASAIGEKAVAADGSWEDIAATALDRLPRHPLLLAVLGAGDIREVMPLLPHTGGK